MQDQIYLQFLSDSFGQFIVNYHMNKIECTKTELINMLVTAEGALKGLRGNVLAAELTSSSKRKSTWKKKKPVKK